MNNNLSIKDLAALYKTKGRHHTSLFELYHDHRHHHGDDQSFTLDGITIYEKVNKLYLARQ
jgi:hypothetical protein